MSEAPESVHFMLGQMTGQLREMVHTLASVSTKQDALGLKVASLDHLADNFSKLDAKVDQLMTKENERTGAVNLGAWLLKTPLVAWVTAAGVTVWAFLKGPGQ